MIQQFPAGRRDVLAAAAAVAGSALFAGSARGETRQEAEPADPVFAPHARDWDWLIGNWSVRHRRLRERLAGSTEWDEFPGTCRNWPLMGGRGNVDDNVLDLPAGRYRGVGVRAFDVQTRSWSIWWIDSRTPGIEPPVRGGFADGVGTFVGDDTLRGRPVKVRFRWSAINAGSAQWDQAFSPDGGTTWETNWHMDFTRAA
jgi:hypothetical protein